MEIKLEPISTGEPFSGTVTTPETALTQRAAILADAEKIVSVTTEDELFAAVEMLRVINDALKVTEDSREKHGKPFYNMWKKVNEFAATFREPLEKPKDRIADLVNGFRRKQLADKEAAETKARKEQEEATKAAEAAAKAITEAEKQNDPVALLDAQLKAEEAAMTAQAASVVLTAPTNTPKGTWTTVFYDFQITDIYAFVALKDARSFLKWKAEDEDLSVDRTSLKKALNHEFGHAWLPPEGQDSITHPFGIRVFRDVKSHVR